MNAQSHNFTSLSISYLSGFPIVSHVSSQRFRSSFFTSFTTKGGHCRKGSDARGRASEEENMADLNYSMYERRKEEKRE